jgi:membrane protease YdiL (CAAX protease family)
MTRFFGATMGVVITGVLFGAFHLDIYRFVPTAVLGIFLSIVALRGGLYLAMIAHAVNNGFAFLWMRHLMIQVEKSGGDALTSDISGLFPTWLFVVAIIVVVIGIYTFFRIGSAEPKRIQHT